MCEMLSFRFPRDFFIKVISLHNSFHVGIIQKIQKFILYEILNIYPRMNFMNKNGFQLFRNYMYNATHHKPFYLVLIAVNKVHMRIIFILDFIFALFQQCIYNILCVVLRLLFLVYLLFLIYFLLLVYLLILSKLQCASIHICSKAMIVRSINYQV